MTGQEPLYYNRRQTGRPHDVPGANDKYVSRYIDVPVEPLYAFGHGLSYTTFAYDALRLGTERLRRDETLTVSVDVTNTGDRAGAEVVQLYVRDEVGSVTRPVMELKGFERVMLAPGQTQTVRFTIRPEDLRFWGPDEVWTVEPGFFTVLVGGSSAETLSARFLLVNGQ